MKKSEALDLIAEKIATCTKCAELAAYRQENNSKTVPGEGYANARVMLIGEAPGRTESETGRPLVGRSGKLFDILIRQVGWDRTNVFITNTIKCRPPANRDPTRDEACNCRPFLDLQIKVIAPDYIVCVGRVAALNLLKPDEVDEKFWFSKSLGSMRGQFWNYNGIKTVATYHPSFLLRTPTAEKQFIADLQLIIEDQKIKINS